MTKNYPWGYEPPVPESELKLDPNRANRCTAHSRRNNRRCNNSAVRGRNVCRLHGGFTRSGLNHWRTEKAIEEGKEPLKYANSAPGRLLRMYMDGLSNPEIVDHNDEIALIEARIGDLLQQSEDGGSAELWRAAKRYYLEYRKMKQINPKMADVAFTDLGEVIEKGNHEIGTWEQILKSVEQRRKLAASHHHQLVQASQLVPVAKVLEMLAEIAKVVQVKVNDPHVVQSILNAIAAQLDEPIEGEYVEQPRQLQPATKTAKKKTG